MKLKLLTEFRKDEHGGILAFYVVMFLLMMVGGGMSIDFMRHEIKREALQDALDRGVLAAAGNAQSSISGVLSEAQTTAAKNAATATVRSYISLAGFDPDAEGVVINPIINATTQKVVASSSFNVDTYFLRLSGIDVLNGAARAGAEVGAQKIEMSLVLDISGSMDTPVLGTSVPDLANPGETRLATRLDLLQSAAKGFAAKMLGGDRASYTSMSIVPFSGQVSISDSLANEYKNFSPWHNYSNCMEFNSSDFSTTAFGQNESRNQYQHFYYPGQRGGEGSGVAPGNVPWCPPSNLNVLPLANDTANIDALINGLSPQSATNTWTGIKWGAALLDHSTQPIVSSLAAAGEINSAFSNRPVAFTPEGGSSDTLKFLIVMADGENYREMIIPPNSYNQTGSGANYTQQSADHWESLKDITTADTDHPAYLMHSYNTNTQQWSLRPEAERTTADQGDTLMQNMCTAAKNNGIIIYTIGTDIAVNSNAWNQMRNCASTTGQFYSVTSDRLDQAFNDIASAIQKLRLVN